MNHRVRLIFLFISLTILVIVGWQVKGDFEFLISDFWFTSGFLLLILLSLIDQPHFSKDSNIFINSITAGISLLLIEEGSRNWIFWIFLGLTFYLGLSSYLIMLFRNKPLYSENKVLQFFSRINRQLGRPEMLFSAFFLWGALSQFGIDSREFRGLLLYWVIFMILNVKELAFIVNSIFEKKDNENEFHASGKIFGVQSKNTFLVKLFPERQTTINRFDFVEFTYSIEQASKVRKGLVLDSYLLNEEQWMKVLTTNEINEIFKGEQIFKSHTKDIIYRIDQVPKTDYLERFIGIISENSRIEKILFHYNSKSEIQEGDLVEVKIPSQKSVYYQVVEGVTKIEQLERKNETGLIVGEAIQLGTWNSEKARFESYGWVPSINSPVYRSPKIEDTKIDGGEYIIGSIPNTNFPVILNKELALTHHTAVLGVTGTGKSVFSRNLIREYLKEDNLKVICIDFTGEYVKNFQDLKITKTISDKHSKDIFKNLDSIVLEEAKGFKSDQKIIEDHKKDCARIFNDSISDFLKGKSKISVFELPDVANSWAILEYTRLFFRLLFHIAKNQNSFGNKLCIVLEEAHTIVPEASTLGVSDFGSKAAINSIAQIALQGRKYNVGLLVIAQRTANVSKTVLTQCNTIISFQEFDRTSSEFLSNYFGQGIAGTLSKLKPRQAIAAGKGLRSNVPMIFEVPEIDESKFFKAEEVKVFK